jgi:hypothetical protein
MRTFPPGRTLDIVPSARRQRRRRSREPRLSGQGRKVSTILYVVAMLLLARYICLQGG